MHVFFFFILYDLCTKISKKITFMIKLLYRYMKDYGCLLAFRSQQCELYERSISIEIIQIFPTARMLYANFLIASSYT